MTLAVIFSTFLLSSILFGAEARSLSNSCGKAYYDPTKYTCYDGEFLCPMIRGKPTFRCGSDCYVPSRYSCENGHLGRQSTSNFFTLIASAPGHTFDQQPIEAVGQLFQIGINGPATYCPDFVVQCPAGNQTVIDRTSLDVEVPGGQQIYIGPDGALCFTQAHSGAYPLGSILGGFGSSGGEFTFSSRNGSGFYACPVPAFEFLPFSPNVVQVFANISGVPANCSSFTILTEDYIGDFAAWEYT